MGPLEAYGRLYVKIYDLRIRSMHQGDACGMVKGTFVYDLSFVDYNMSIGSHGGYHEAGVQRSPAHESVLKADSQTLQRLSYRHAARCTLPFEAPMTAMPVCKYVDRSPTQAFLLIYFAGRCLGKSLDVL